MEECNWYYPKSFDELRGLLKDNENRICAGGTDLLRTGVSKVKGFINLDSLPLKNFSLKQNSLEIGANLTFSEVIRKLEKKDQESILFKALSSSLSFPLRNRVTVGGSLMSSPIWSDIIGPLSVLEAELELVGPSKSEDKKISIENFYKLKNNRKSFLIKNIKITQEAFKSYYFRLTRTSFDYSGFNLSILLKSKASRIDEIRVAVVGCTDKVKRLEELERDLKGKNKNEIDLPELVKKHGVKFSNKKFGSAEYLEEVFAVELERGLNTILS